MTTAVSLFEKIKPSVIGVMLLNGRLNSYLQQVNEQTDEMYFQMVKQFAKQEGVTEELKNRNQRAWVGTMNNIRDRADFHMTVLENLWYGNVNPHKMFLIQNRQFKTPAFPYGQKPW